MGHARPAPGDEQVAGARVEGKPDGNPAGLARNKDLTVPRSRVRAVDRAVRQRARKELVTATGHDALGLEPVG